MSTEPYVPSKKTYKLYSGVTNASGDYTIAYGKTYAVTPMIIPVQTPTTSSARTVRIISSTTTGFTVRVEQRNSVNLLGFDVLLSSTVVVNAANVSVIVLE